MKKRVAIFLVFCFVCASLWGCSNVSAFGAVTFNDDQSQLYYQDHTYNRYDGDLNFGGFEPDDTWLYIGSSITYPGKIIFLPGLAEYYGDAENNPAVIRRDGKSDLYVREDIRLDYSSTLRFPDGEKTFLYSFQEITTGNIIPYSTEMEQTRKYFYDMIVEFEEYPMLRIQLVFGTINDGVYLQTQYGSDFYEVTEEFAAILQQFEDCE